MRAARDQALEARARRAAKRIGLRAIKSPSTGRFMLVDVDYDAVVDGRDFTLSARDVIDRCSEASASLTFSAACRTRIADWELSELSGHDPKP
jgi:hypothetical protein